MKIIYKHSLPPGDRTSINEFVFNSCCESLHQEWLRQVPTETVTLEMPFTRIELPGLAFSIRPYEGEVTIEGKCPFCGEKIELEPQEQKAR